MPISYTYSTTVQLTDGNWNANPDPTPEAGNVETTQTVDINLSLSESIEWTGVLDFDVIGDFNDPGEVLEVTIGDDTARLFDDDTTNDVWFTGESTGPTNGTDNPLLGAQPAQGNVTINGDNILTDDDIADIKTDTAVFSADDSVSLSGDLGTVENGTLSIDFAISNYLQPEDGVDFAEVDMDLTVSGDWYGDHAISNVVFYLESSSGIQKIKIDDWDQYSGKSGSTSFDSTEDFIFSEDSMDAFAASLGLVDDFSFVGMTIKAGNNREDGFRPNQANGEGEIIFGDIMDDYGKLNMNTISVDAAIYLDEFLIC